MTISGLVSAKTFFNLSRSRISPLTEFTCFSIASIANRLGSVGRAGNVIGGGDFAADRIVPDCVRAAVAKKEIIIRNPYAVRPFQHVSRYGNGSIRIAAKSRGILRKIAKSVPN